MNFYNDLEYDHWILVETNTDIENFCKQLVKVSGNIAGKKAESIFDMWIKWGNGDEEFVEVKYSKDLLPTSPNFEKVFNNKKKETNKF